MKYFKTILVFLAIIGTGAFAYYKGISSTLVNKQQSQDVNVVLEQIEKATKLVSAEGTFSELFQHKDFYNWDVSFLRKEALIRVKAKALVGFDFNALQITTDKRRKKITISNFPTEAKLIAIDHDIDYYDLEEGMFNSFTKENYNQLNKEAKDHITSVAKNSELISTANEQRVDLIAMIKSIGKSIGYSVDIIEQQNSNDLY